ncbi:ShlB/FhaC/HecB family hemolysin secretion/activation protein [Ramlibacter henchirensis]|uniref:ShlB/FhaC/HecB family hemolysin secretion/activation protein n=1 Tax=Ramlibacter henchirensis TaxID=204072 RepID=A0A4Z0BUQ7_9BURK|nr:ShlB/FhaC/HecB family hemolysin secretion/activation protein [Ramlibacter henchirensis]TFZ03057.1 ShlB/FhaC/HecB family hemolysin secretion/activation protein [Ramlibacter henchirensis]
MSKGNRAPAARRCAAAVSVLAAALAGTWGPAFAQTRSPTSPPPLRSAPEPVFQIRGFHVTGDNPLPAGETARVLAPFLRTEATMSTLQQATVALETALREAGYGLHRVALPPQEVGSTVRLEVVRFTVSRVTIEGAQINGEGNIRRTVPELQEGQTPNFKRLAVQTAIANENPNKQVQVGLREADEPDRIDATITVKESRPWNVLVNASNTGSDSTGRDRLTVAGSHSNLFDRDHQFTGAYTTSVERTSDVRQLGLAYRAPLYEQGGVLGASYTRSDVVGSFGAFTSTGAGHTTAVNYTHYLAPQGGRRSYLSLGLEDKVFNAARINDVVVPGALDRRSRPLVLGYNARTETNTSTWGYNLALAFNTGGGRANNLVSYQSEDPRITTTSWKALRGSFNYATPLEDGWLLSFRTEYQYSPDVLISGEQFGIGGYGSVRGTAIERPLSADKGVAATLEALTPELLPGLRLFGFADAGHLWNNDPNGLNKPSTDRLASLGLGLRYNQGAFVGSLEYGRLVTGSRVPVELNSAAPERGDDRLYVNLGLRF